MAGPLIIGQLEAQPPKSARGGRVQLTARELLTVSAETRQTRILVTVGPDGAALITVHRSGYLIHHVDVPGEDTVRSECIVREAVRQETMRRLGRPTR